MVFSFRRSYMLLPLIVSGLFHVLIESAFMNLYYTQRHSMEGEFGFKTASQSKGKYLKEPMRACK